MCEQKHTQRQNDRIIKSCHLSLGSTQFNSDLEGGQSIYCCTMFSSHKNTVRFAEGQKPSPQRFQTLLTLRTSPCMTRVYVCVWMNKSTHKCQNINWTKGQTISCHSHGLIDLDQFGSHFPSRKIPDFTIFQLQVES